MYARGWAPTDGTLAPRTHVLSRRGPLGAPANVHISALSLASTPANVHISTRGPQELPANAHIPTRSSQEPPRGSQELPANVHISIRSPQELPRSTSEPPQTSQEPQETAQEPQGPPGAQESPSFFPPSILLPPSSLFLPPSLLPPPSFLPLQTVDSYFWQTNLCTNPCYPYRGAGGTGRQPLIFTSGGNAVTTKTGERSGLSA